MEQNTILLLGAGGVSMHQLALAYKRLGYIVYGYDAKPSAYTKILEQNGIKMYYRFNSYLLQVDKCIKTGAIKEDNKFVRLLRARGTPVLDRAQALGELCAHFKCVIAVAGTHGKSTTAALIYEVLRTKYNKTSCHIGADILEPRFELNDDFLVVEACEYNKSFLSLHPNIAVITNVEAEHMDSYKTMFNLRSAFLTFFKRASIRFAYKEKSTQFLKSNNTIFVDGSNLNFNPKLKGEHNLKNICLAAAVCQQLGVDDATIVKAINNFAGLKRRYEYFGTKQNTHIYIDYAHHPTEVNAFTSTFLAEHPDALIVFQPHTYSRTLNLLPEFISVLKNIKNLCIFKEYPAREKKTDGLTAHDLYLKLKPVNANVKYIATASSAQKQALKFAFVAFVGAGDINKVAIKIIKS